MIQGLHSLVSSLPNDSQQLIEAFHHRFRPRKVGTLMTDTLAMDTPSHDHDGTPKDLDRETVNLLRRWKHRHPDYSRLSTPSRAHHLKKFGHHGMELKPVGVSSKDSLVIIEDDTRWRAARLQALLNVKLYPFGVERCYTLAKVIYFSELSEGDSLHDPYRRFRNAGRVFYAEDERGAGDVVSVDEILCQFGLTHGVCSEAIPKAHVHVLPLIRVSVLSYTFVPAN